MAIALGETEGMVKVISDGRQGRILGVHILGAEATELIAEAGLALSTGAAPETIARSIHAQPTPPGPHTWTRRRARPSPGPGIVAFRAGDRVFQRGAWGRHHVSRPWTVGGLPDPQSGGAWRRRTFVPSAA